jgi:ribonuclease Y
MVEILLAVGVLLILGGVIALLLGYRQQYRANGMIRDAKQRLENVKRDIDVERREAMVRLKDELYKRRSECEMEVRKEHTELDRLQNKVNARLETIEKKEQRFDEIQGQLEQKERALSRASDILHVQEQKVKTLGEELITRLETLSGLTKDEARVVLMRQIEGEARGSSEKLLQKIEEETRQVAKERSAQIVVNAMQRVTLDQIEPHSSGIFHLPNDEMKGRIIGKEGRNIKALEMATGMEFVIGDTPEVITISGFNPIRREIARRTLERLVADGRINPTRIEETVAQCEKEIEEITEEYGKKAILQFNLQGVKAEMVSLLGKLHFRTSFSQNVLLHSIEVALFARMIAEELGLARPDIALRAGLFHDIGKALSAECEGPHALIGADVCRRCGEESLVVNAIAGHHEETPFASIYAPIVLIADMISASRPGARRETLSTYIKRLEKLEEVALSFEGVKRAYAVQACREIRVIVEEEILDDDKSLQLARDMARKIEKEMTFPGQIKVNVIREKRAIEYAR